MFLTKYEKGPKLFFLEVETNQYDGSPSKASPLRMNVGNEEETHLLGARERKEA